jgi:hypothetical protein
MNDRGKKALSTPSMLSTPKSGGKELLSCPGVGPEMELGRRPRTTAVDRICAADGMAGSANSPIKDATLKGYGALAVTAIRSSARCTRTPNMRGPTWGTVPTPNQNPVSGGHCQTGKLHQRLGTGRRVPMKTV